MQASIKATRPGQRAGVAGGARLLPPPGLHKHARLPHCLPLSLAAPPQPAKLVGELSEAMILAADHTPVRQGGGGRDVTCAPLQEGVWWGGCAHAERARVAALLDRFVPPTKPNNAQHPQEGGEALVRVLSVPEGCSPGDAVYLEGSQPGADAGFPKECKSKVGGGAAAAAAAFAAAAAGRVLRGARERCRAEDGQPGSPAQRVPWGVQGQGGALCVGGWVGGWVGWGGTGSSTCLPSRCHVPCCLPLPVPLLLPDPIHISPPPPPQVWKEVVAGLAVAGGRPTYKGTPLVTAQGALAAADMPDGSGIH